MLVYVYLQHLCNAILCSRMYVRRACATIVQFSGQNVPGDHYCLKEEHNHMYKRFKSLPRSLHIAYDFCNALKIHLMFAECVAL